jgi:TIR domain
VETKYQLVTIGHENSFKERIINTFFERISELGLQRDSVEVIDESDYSSKHENNAPTVALYFGGANSDYPHLAILDDLIHEAAFVLPVVDDINNFNSLVPDQLSKINGFQLKNQFDFDPLVASILEGFSLLRTSRRIFISYRRAESTGVAIQLYEAFERAGFDVFLDTHSVRPGDNFQEELWHRLADTDVVVLLNTPGFCSSKWTTEELAKASGMSIAILQVIWPENKSLDASQLTIPIELTSNDFDNSLYKEANSTLFGPTVPKLVSQVESLRARALAARQDNLTTEFKRIADKLNVLIKLQPQKYITLEVEKAKKKIIIPTIGVPQAFTYNQSDERVKKYITSEEYDVYLLYDHKNIRESWLNHLAWLDDHLPVKSFRIVHAESWLTSNN